VSQLLAAARTSTASVRALLVATLLLGAGQQLFVITRNPYLAELGWRTDAIPAVQATGAIAGVLSGILATFFIPRLRLHVAFAACAAVQALGFALQAFASAPPTFFLGAAIAGLAIQLNTAIAPPALKSLTRANERVPVFMLHALSLTPLAGLFAAAAVFAVTTAFGAAARGHRAVLFVGALVTACACVAFLAVAGQTEARRRPGPLARPRRVAFCVGFQGLIGLAAGITVPFLQLYFKVTFGVALPSIALLYASTMAIGTVAYAVVPWLSRRFGVARAIVLLQLLTLPFFVELARASNVYVAAGAFVARYTLAAMASPLINAFFQEVSFERDGEAVAGLGMIASSLTWAAGTWLAGPLLDRGGGHFSLAIAVSAGLYAVIALCAAVGFRRLARDRPAA